MKKHTQIIICLLLSISSLKAQNPDYNTILSEIDADIKIADGYDRARNTRINDLKGSLVFYPSDSARYYTHRALYEEFKEISNDSALVHIEKAIEIADKLGRKDLRASALASMAMQCAIAGLYYESRMMLNDVDTSLLDNASLIIYYRARWKTYRDLAQYTYVESLRVQYEGWANAAIDSIVARAPKNSDFYYRFMGEKLLDAGNFNEALDLSNHWLSMIAGDTRRLASAMYERHKIFKSLNQHEEMKLCLALSGLYDLRNGIKDQFSLFTLARYLKEDGDTERARMYISYAWKMANEFGTNLRMSQTLPILYDIEDDFKLKLSKQATQLKIAISIVFALAIIAFVLLFISYFQRKKLIDTRQKLRISNSNLDKLNKELHAENSKLDMMNNELLETKEALSDTNIKLSENNRIKEEYIGRFLSLCSLYVEKNKSLKNNALKMLKARQFAELQEKLKNTKQDEKELEDLYKYFDEAFIHLFPTFVKHFNLLLREGERIYPPTGRLNTQIRIFALIRLGVEDSSRIAEFLNYSPNTIYNYRAKVKNGAIERDSFEDDVKNIN